MLKTGVTQIVKYTPQFSIKLIKKIMDIDMRVNRVITSSQGCLIAFVLQCRAIDLQNHIIGILNVKFILMIYETTFTKSLVLET